MVINYDNIFAYVGDANCEVVCEFIVFVRVPCPKGENGTLLLTFHDHRLSVNASRVLRHPCQDMDIIVPTP